MASGEGGREGGMTQSTYGALSVCNISLRIYWSYLHYILSCATFGCRRLRNAKQRGVHFRAQWCWLSDFLVYDLLVFSF